MQDASGGSVSLRIVPLIWSMESNPAPVTKPGSRFEFSPGFPVWPLVDLGAAGARDETRRKFKPGRRANPEEKHPLDNFAFKSIIYSSWLASRLPFSSGFPVTIFSRLPG